MSPTNQRKSTTFSKDLLTLNQTTFTFPGHFPTRISAFLHYLETEGGCSEDTVDILLLQGDAELLVELTCWILDKLNGSIDPQNPTNDYDDINSSFSIGMRFQTQSVIDRLGINLGPIPTNDRYLAPLLALTQIKTNEDPRPDVLYFLYVLRGRTDWSSGEQFRNAYLHHPSQYLEFVNDISTRCKSGVIPIKHNAWAASGTRIIELIFFKTFETVPQFGGSDETDNMENTTDNDPNTTTTATTTANTPVLKQLPKPTPMNDLAHTHCKYDSFQNDEILLAFDRRASAQEFLSWLGLHNDDLWFSDRRSIYESIVGGSYQTNVQRLFSFLTHLTRYWDYYSYNYRIYELSIQLSATGYLYSLLPQTIKEADHLSNSHQDHMYDQFKSIVDQNIDEIYDLCFDFVTDLSKFPQSVHNHQFFQSLALGNSLSYNRLGALSTYWHDGPTTAIGTHFWNVHRDATSKKHIKKEKQALEECFQRKVELIEIIAQQKQEEEQEEQRKAAVKGEAKEEEEEEEEKNSADDKSKGAEAITHGDQNDTKTIPTDSKSSVPSPNQPAEQSVLTIDDTDSKSSTRLSTTISPQTELDALLIMIPKMEADIAFCLEQRAFYQHQAHCSLQLYELFYSRFGFTLTRVETLKALLCLALVEGDDVLLERLSLYGLTKDTFIRFTSKSLVANVAASPTLIEDAVLIKTDDITSYRVNSDDFYYNTKGATSGVSLHQQCSQITQNWQNDEIYPKIYNLAPFHLEAFRFHIIGDKMAVNPWLSLFDALVSVAVPECMPLACKLLGNKTLAEMIPDGSDIDPFYFLLHRAQFDSGLLAAYFKCKPTIHWHPYSATPTQHYHANETNTTIWDSIAYADLSDEQCVALFEQIWELYIQTPHYQATLQGAAAAAAAKRKAGSASAKKNTIPNQSNTAMTTAATNVELVSFQTLLRWAYFSLDRVQDRSIQRSKTFDWVSKHLISPDVLTRNLTKNFLSLGESNLFSAITNFFIWDPSSNAQMADCVSSRAWIRWKSRNEPALCTKAILQLLFPLKSHIQKLYLENTLFLFRLMIFSGSADVANYVFSRINSALEAAHLPYILHKVLPMYSLVADHRDLVDFHALYSLYHSERLGLITAEEIKLGIKSHFSRQHTVGAVDTHDNGDAGGAIGNNDDNRDKSHKNDDGDTSSKLDPTTASSKSASTAIINTTIIDHLIKTDQYGTRYLPHYPLPHASWKLMMESQDNVPPCTQFIAHHDELPLLPSSYLKASMNNAFSTQFNATLADMDQYNFFYQQYDRFYQTEVIKLGLVPIVPAQYILDSALHPLGNRQHQKYPYGNIATFIPKQFLADYRAGKITPSQHQELLPARSRSSRLPPSAELSGGTSSDGNGFYRDLDLKPTCSAGLLLQSLDASQDLGFKWNWPFALYNGEPDKPLYSYRQVISNYFQSPNFLVPLYKRQVGFSFLRDEIIIGPATTSPDLAGQLRSLDDYYEGLIQFSPQSQYHTTSLPSAYHIANKLEYHGYAQQKMYLQQQNAVMNRIKTETPLFTLPLWSSNHTSLCYHQLLTEEFPKPIQYGEDIDEFKGIYESHLVSTDPGRFYQHLEPFSNNFFFLFNNFSNTGNLSPLSSSSLSPPPPLSSPSSSSSLLPALSVYINHLIGQFFPLLLSGQADAHRQLQPHQFTSGSAPVDVTLDVPSQVRQVDRSVVNSHYHSMTRVSSSTSPTSSSITISVRSNTNGTRSMTIPNIDTSLHTSWEYWAKQEYSQDRYDLASDLSQSSIVWGILSPVTPDIPELIPNPSPDAVRSPRGHKCVQPKQATNWCPNMEVMGFCKWYTTTTSIPRIYKSPILLSYCYFLLNRLHSMTDIVFITLSYPINLSEGPNILPVVQDLLDELSWGFRHIISTPNQAPKLAQLPQYDPTKATVQVPLELHRLKLRYSRLDRGIASPGDSDGGDNDDMVFSQHLAFGAITNDPLQTRFKLNPWIGQLFTTRRYIRGLSAASSIVDYHLDSIRIGDNGVESSDDVHDARVVANPNSLPSPSRTRPLHRRIATPWETTYSFNMSPYLVHHSLTDMYCAIARDDSAALNFELGTNCRDSLTPPAFNPFQTLIGPPDIMPYSIHAMISKIFSLFKFLPFIPPRLLKIAIHLLGSLSSIALDPTPFDTYADPLSPLQWLQRYKKLEVLSRNSRVVSQDNNNSPERVIPVPLFSHLCSATPILDLIDIYLAKNKILFITLYRKQVKLQTRRQLLESNVNHSIIQQSLSKSQHRQYLLEILLPYQQLSQIYQFTNTNQDFIQFYHRLAPPTQRMSILLQQQQQHQLQQPSPPPISSLLQYLHSFSLFNPDANYLFNRYISTMNQFPYLWYGSNSPMGTKETSVLNAGASVALARSIILHHSVQPNIFTKVLFNRDYTISPAESKFIQQWSHLRNIPSPTTNPTGSGFNTDEVFGPVAEYLTPLIDTVDQLYSVPAGNDPDHNHEDNNLSTNSSLLPHSNPEHHITHLEHTPLMSNLNSLQIIERQQFKHIPHLPVSYSFDSEYINGLSLLVRRYFDVFEGTEFDDHQDDESDVDNSQQQHKLTSSQLVTFLKSNLNHDLYLMNHLQSLIVVDSATKTDTMNKYTRLQEDFGPISWTKILAGMGLGAVIGTVAAGVYQWYTNSSAFTTMTDSGGSDGTDSNPETEPLDQ